jgi:putative SOS response-associated peptidase YedK
MCTSYESTPAVRFESYSLFPEPTFDYPREVFKDYIAPVIRRAEEGFTTDPASFGIVPRKRIPKGAKVFDTMNARAETLAERRSFKAAWTKLQLALIPCRFFYEPNYETGKAVRWRIGLSSDKPLAIAGLWRSWKEADGSEALSFTMLTVNADEHPLMKRFHRPGSEKRSVVIVPEAEYAPWLTCRTTDEAYTFLRLYPADAMHAEPYPLRSRVPKAAGDAGGTNGRASGEQTSLLPDE